MLKTETIKIKSFENEKIIIAMTMTKVIIKTAIMKIIPVIMTIFTIKISDRIKI